MPDDVTTRDALQELAEKPLGPSEEFIPGEAAELTKRISKVWLPAGKRSASGREARAARKAFRERQIDLEEAVEAAGGHRGSARP